LKLKALLVAVTATALALGISGCSNAPNEPVIAAPPAPAFTLEQLQASINFNDANFVTADDGEVVFGSNREAPTPNPYSTAFRSMGGPDGVWNGAPPVSHGSPQFTLFDAVAMEGGNLGILQIPKINLTVNVYDTPDEIEAMRHGVAHLRETSAWVGNVGLAGHDSGEGDFFRNLNQLVIGDEIRFTTAAGEKTYRVESSAVVHESDWSLFGMTSDNRLTLVTCVQTDASMRLVVQALEITVE